MDQAELDQKLTDMEAQLTAAVAKQDTLEAIVKAYQELETDDRDAFATLSAEQQQEYVKADDTNKEEILSKARKEIEKANDDPEPDELPEPVRKRLEDLEKQAEEAATRERTLQERVAKAEDAAFTAEMVAKAEAEFPNFADTAETVGAVLKSLYCEGLDNDQREAIYKLLSQGNEALGQLTRAVGSDAPGEVAKSFEAIEKVAVKKFGGNGVSDAEAFDLYIQTPEGKKAYDEYEVTKAGGR
jgi:hypothetical protein